MFSATKDERALKKWKEMQSHWDRFQKRMAVKLGKVRFHVITSETSTRCRW
jgi:hypothetical protein